MNDQLKGLIEKIKNEGVSKAEAEGRDIVSKAQAEADGIIAKAKEKAASIVADAQAEGEKFKQSASDAVKHAGRDLVLSLKAQIEKLFSTVIAKTTAEVYKQNVLEEAIISAVKGWKEDSVADMNVLLSEADLKTVEASLKAKLGDAIKKGVEFKTSSNVKAGFEIGMKDGSAYYNFSAEGIAELLAEYLNPKIGAIIDEAVKEEN